MRWRLLVFTIEHTAALSAALELLAGTSRGLRLTYRRPKRKRPHSRHFLLRFVFKLMKIVTGYTARLISVEAERPDSQKHKPFSAERYQFTTHYRERKQSLDL